MSDIDREQYEQRLVDEACDEPRDPDSRPETLMRTISEPRRVYFCVKVDYDGWQTGSTGPMFVTKAGAKSYLTSHPYFSEVHSERVWASPEQYDSWLEGKID